MTEAKMNKQWYKSKTVWVGILSVIGGLSVFFGVEPNPTTVTAIAGVLGGLGAIFLRDSIGKSK